ncbi:putative phosphatidate phosphatase [Antedon mediterranea]|uniref:putative phosphatidate phosphatase n=1 Tax=Antedon mediterranea TaxID=105859 RepID=UPI003AF57CB6
MVETLELVFDFLLIFIECTSLYCISKYMPMWHMPGHLIDDVRYSYPYVQDTVTSAFLVELGFIIPIASFIVFEIWTNKTHSKVYAFLNQFTKCTFGILFVLNIGTALKHVSGVPRPYYNAVCQPKVKLLEQEHYIAVNDDVICENTKYHEAIRSFPSLHAGVAFYFFVYLSCYYESRWTLKKFVLLKPMLQGLMFLGAIFTSCSRITEYKHHVSDVIVGSALGILSALFVIVSATDFFQRKPNIPPSNTNQTKVD